MLNDIGDKYIDNFNSNLLYIISLVIFSLVITLIKINQFILIYLITLFILITILSVYF